MTVGMPGRFWGEAVMKVAHPHLAKLDPKGLKVIFIGYEPRSKAYRIYDPAGGGGGERICLAPSSSTKVPSRSGTT